MKITENNFLHQLCIHNEQALLYIMNQYGGLIKSIIHKHLYAISQYEEECFDDVFLSVWQNISYYKKEQCSFKSWIAAIARYQSIDYQRKYMHELKQENIDDLTLSSEDSSIYRFLEQDLSEELTAMMNCLKKEDRELFYKLYLEEKEMEEVSNETGLKKEVIYNRLSRGKKKLRKLFSNKKGASTL